MVSFGSTITCIATLFCVVDLALGNTHLSTGNRGPGLTLKVLTGTAPNACTPQKVKDLKTHLTETVTLAEDASKALKVRGVEFSDAFLSFLGSADPKQMDAQHFAPVASLRSVVLESVTSDKGHSSGVRATAPATETLFICLAASDVRCSVQGDTTGKANGVVAVSNLLEHTVKICPMFFEKATLYNPYTKKDYTVEPLSLATGKASYLAGKDAESPLPAKDLFHELQHLPSVVGKYWADDLYIHEDNPKVVVPRPDHYQWGKVTGIIGVYRVNDCIKIPAGEKRFNAQNLAFFALDVHADPHRGRPASFGATKADKIGKRMPERFEAIHEHGLDKNAAPK